MAKPETAKTTDGMCDENCPFLEFSDNLNFRCKALNAELTYYDGVCENDESAEPSKEETK